MIIKKMKSVKKYDLDLSRKDESLKNFTNKINGRVVLQTDGRSALGHVCYTLTWNK